MISQISPPPIRQNADSTLFACDRDQLATLWRPRQGRWKLYLRVAAAGLGASAPNHGATNRGEATRGQPNGPQRPGCANDRSGVVQSYFNSGQSVRGRTYYLSSTLPTCAFWASSSTICRRSSPYGAWLLQSA